MHPDPIIEEVRQVRQDFAKRHHYDLHAMAADLQAREHDHADRLVTLPAKPARTRKTA